MTLWPLGQFNWSWRRGQLDFKGWHHSGKPWRLEATRPVRLRDLRHVLPMYKRPHTQVDHVPWCAVVVAHEVEGQGHVGVAVVQAQVVLQQIKCKKWITIIRKNNLENYETYTHAQTQACINTARKCGRYRSTLVLLRSIVHGFVPRGCTIATDFVYIQLPKPGVRNPAVMVVSLTNSVFWEMNLYLYLILISLMGIGIDNDIWYRYWQHRVIPWSGTLLQY